MVKKELSIEEIERQALLELPDRKLMSLLQVPPPTANGKGKREIPAMRPFQLYPRRLGVFSLLVSLLILVVITTATIPSATAAAAQHAATAPVQRHQPAAKAALNHFELHFRTTYPRGNVDIALLYRDYSGVCAKYGGWATEGWWKVSWGGDNYVLSTRNRYVYFYAYSEDGVAKWSGTDSYMYVNPRYKFSSCRDIVSSTWKRVGLRQIDMGSSFNVYTYTMLYGG